MTDKEEHPIRNGIIIAVVSAIILTLIPDVRSLIISVLQSIWRFLVLVWGHLTSESKLPWGVIWLLIIMSIPTVYKIFKRLVKQKPWEPSFEEYREDRMFNVDWKWSGFWGKMPENLSGFCPVCQTRLIYNYDILNGTTSFHCESCGSKPVTLDGDLNHALSTVGRQIERKINSGEWEQIVRKRHNQMET